MHYNLSPPEGQTEFGGEADKLAQALGRLAQEMQGSFAAEHRLGRSKIAMADQLRDPVERQLMAQIKAALDPEGTMNPGVVVAEAR